MPYKALRIALLLIGGLGMLSAGPGSGTAVAQSIYDSRIQHRIDLTAQQRPKVLRIVEEHKRQTLAVLQKHGIDPHGRPIFDKLVDASGELLAIARRERQLMKEILTPEQMIEYDRIIEDLRIRVRAAAR